MIVLDTNVLAELMRPAPDPAVLAWLGAHQEKDLVTTAMSVAEVRFGIARLPAGARRKSLQLACDRVFAAFAEQILAFEVAAAVECGDLLAARERSGRRIHITDAQIASVCLVNDATLATRDRDFDGLGLRLVDPWSLEIDEA